MTRWRRLLCKVFGHRMFHEARGEPVLAFPACRRCGKFARYRRAA